MRGIPRSHRFARSRPLTLREGGLLSASIRATPCHSEHTTVIPSAPDVIPSEARNLPPFAKRKGG